MGVILFDDFVGCFGEFALLFLLRVGGGVHFEDALLYEVGADDAFLLWELAVDDGVVGFVEV